MRRNLKPSGARYRDGTACSPWTRAPDDADIAVLVLVVLLRHQGIRARGNTILRLIWVRAYSLLIPSIGAALWPEISATHIAPTSPSENLFRAGTCHNNGYE
ncbi:hypothetical protein BD310DRAFT_941140 [Dichomitus squalens]|uniref:Uncharacterized protein n=1 Tax=Dichomitus squalens TaxID=114155 RepID=A0A4Q9PGB1_9APHY|nr:hypothetical protein BD310DRAFT_941140 [Dichomitus squalens]